MTFQVELGHEFRTRVCISHSTKVDGVQPAGHRDIEFYDNIDHVMGQGASSNSINFAFSMIVYK